MKNYLFELKEGLLISLRAIRANKVRSVLTTIGIVIGITAVVLMSTAVTGINNSFQQGVSALGSDNLYIDKWAWFNNDIPWWEMRNRKNLSMEDYKKYEKLARLPEASAPTVWTMQTVKYKDKTLEFARITGTSEKYINTTNLDFSRVDFLPNLKAAPAEMWR